MERLVATLEKRRSGARIIKLTGVLDKDHRLDELAHEAASGLAIINLAGIDRVDDNNTDEWLKWIAMLTPGQTRPTVIACSPAVVEQLNRIDQLTNKLVVKSFYVPYLCEECEHHQLHLAHVAQFKSAAPRAPVCLCEKCGNAMVFEGEASKYFAFLPPLIRASKAAGETPSVAETPSTPPPDLARGSRADVTIPERARRVSRPQLLRPSHSAMSVTQFMANVRGSANTIAKPQDAPISMRWLLIMLVVMLLAMLAAFAYFVAA